MSDRWWGYIEIADVPASWVTEEQRSYGDGDPYTVHALVTEAMPQPVRDALTFFGDFEEVEYDADARTLKLSDDQLAGGSYRFQEDGLTDALMDAGLPFEGGDDGMYEFAGTFWWWKPGMEGMEERTAAADQGIVLTEHELRALVAATNSREELLTGLRAHFNLESDDELAPKAPVVP